MMTYTKSDYITRRKCPDCNKVYENCSLYFCCPKCGSRNKPVSVVGQNLYAEAPGLRGFFRSLFTKSNKRYLYFCEKLQQKPEPPRNVSLREGNQQLKTILIKKKQRHVKKS